MSVSIATKKKQKTLALVVVLTLMTGLSGCAIPWQKKWPAPETPTVDLPATPPKLAPLSIDREWWKAFGDATLNGLVADALANNLDLAKAATNVAEARANVGAANAMLSPRADAQGNASATRRQLSVASQDLNHTTTSATAGVGVSWEIDLWGRTRQMNEPLARSVTFPALPTMPSEFDSALLLRRPYVASAEQMLAATNADVNATRTERLPRLNLGLLAGLIASSSSAITGFPLYGDLSAGVSAPIYDAGLVQSKVDAAVARKDNAIAHYRHTLALAFRDVYTAMIDRDAGDRPERQPARDAKLERCGPNGDS